MASTLMDLARGGRRVVLAAARAAGVSNRLADSEWRRRRLLILCYHGVALRDEHEWDPEVFVTPAFLRRRFEILRDGGYAVLPLGPAIDLLRAGELPQRAVAITFDDGFYDFSAAAVPLLQEFGYAATLYLSTYHCVYQRPLLLLSLEYLLWRARGTKFPAHILSGHAIAADLTRVTERKSLARRLASAARTFGNDRDKQMIWLSQIADSLGVDWQDFLQSRILHFMSPSEVTEVSRRGIDVQLHTHRHRTPRDEKSFRLEILENREIVESLTNLPATHFCYPEGDCDATFFSWLRDLGVKTATTCATGLAKRESNPLALPRFVDTSLQTELMFGSWLSGVAGMSRRDAR